MSVLCEGCHLHAAVATISAPSAVPDDEGRQALPVRSVCASCLEAITGTEPIGSDPVPLPEPDYNAVRAEIARCERVGDDAGLSAVAGRLDVRAAVCGHRMLPVDLWTFLARRVPVWSNLEPELRVPAPSQAIADEYVLTRLAELIEDGTAAAVLDRVVARQRGNRAASVLVAFAPALRAALGELSERPFGR